MVLFCFGSFIYVFINCIALFYSWCTPFIILKFYGGRYDSCNRPSDPMERLINQWEDLLTNGKTD